MKQIECIIRGRVQMVMFRDFTMRKARKLGLVGFVENLPDGSVHVVAEGDENALEDIVAYLHQGSILSRVDDVSITWQPASGEFTSFSIKY